MGGNGADTITAGTFNSAALIGAGAGQDSLVFANFVAGGTVNAGAGIDTVTFTSAADTIFNGGSEADLIGLNSAGGSEIHGGTVNGGNGADTIRLENLRSGNAGAQVLGGDGNDSIVLGTGNSVLSFGDSSTVNGGAGVDTVSLIGVRTGLDVAAGNSAYNFNVAYGASDVIRFDFGSTVSANWITTVTGTITVLTAASTTGANIAAMTGVGSVAVFADSTQTVIYVTASGQTSFYAVNIIGKDLVNTQTFGAAVTFNSTNFGFTLGNSNGTGLNITLA
jgi:hypothetical protein